jgi:hypothetical protein
LAVGVAGVAAEDTPHHREGAAAAAAVLLALLLSLFRQVIFRQRKLSSLGLAE